MVLEVVSGDALKYFDRDLHRDTFGDHVIDGEVFIKRVKEDHVGILIGKTKLTFVRLALPEACRRCLLDDLLWKVERTRQLPDLRFIQTSEWLQIRCAVTEAREVSQIMLGSVLSATDQRAQALGQ